MSSTVCDFLFVQNNARPHTPKKTNDYFNEEEINLLPWPPFSPDLNIMEYVCYMRSINVCESSQFRSLEQLQSRMVKNAQEVQKEKKNVIIEMFNNYTNQLIYVIKSNGEINNYLL